MKTLYVVAFILLLIGGLNWGLVGFFGFDLVAWLFGAGATLSTIIYSLVGISAVFVAISYFTDPDCCKK